MNGHNAAAQRQAMPPEQEFYGFKFPMLGDDGFVYTAVPALVITRRDRLSGDVSATPVGVVTGDGSGERFELHPMGVEATHVADGWLGIVNAVDGTLERITGR